MPTNANKQMSLSNKSSELFHLEEYLHPSYLHPRYSHPLHFISYNHPVPTGLSIAQYTPGKILYLTFSQYRSQSAPYLRLHFSSSLISRCRSKMAK